MHEPLLINDQILIPGGELQFSFARSAGPGGQNVNKLNTKAILRWDVTNSRALPAAVRERFVARYANRITTAGELVIAADKYRLRARNISECRERLRAMLLSVATAPRRRRATRVPRGAKEARLKSKRQQSQKKQQRRRPQDDD